MAVNQYERAFRTWPLLVTAAAEHTTITYKDLAAHLGIHPRPIRHILGVIQDYCLAEKLPPITILVVSSANHLPGEGFIAWDIDDLPQGLTRVYGFPWSDLPNPFAFAAGGDSELELARELVDAPDQASSIYARIQNRGFAQTVFRQALLTAYGRACAFCALSIPAALEAAHLIPWSVATSAQRIAPSNGLLLCATHHSLFDSGFLGVGPDQRIRCAELKSHRRRWSDADAQWVFELDGRMIRLPVDERLRPSAEALLFRWQRDHPTS